MNRDVRWEEYYSKVSPEPREAVLRAIRYFSTQDAGDKSALDLGCGNGRDTLALLENGWTVTAVDNQESCEKFLKQNIPAKYQSKYEFVCASFEEFSFGSYMLINAGYSLPFAGKENYTELLEKVTNSIKSGGVFTGNFFGENDEWQELALLTRKQVSEVLRDFELICFNEEERDGETVTGTPKHWHIFDVTAVKL